QTDYRRASPYAAGGQGRVAGNIAASSLYRGGIPVAAPTVEEAMMRIERRYTREGQSPYAGIEFRLTASEIRNPDGSVVFRADDVEVPSGWSQVAADVIAQKY